MLANKFAPRLLLLALAAASLAVQSYAQDRCTVAEYGIINNNPHPLPREILTPGNVNSEVFIQTACPDEVGVLVQVCDIDVAPEVRVENLGLALVHRRGKLLGAVTVDAVVYCAASGLQPEPTPERRRTRNHH